MSEYIRRVDDMSRVVIPKEFRKRLGITYNTQLEISMEEDKIVLRKHPDAAAKVDIGYFAED